MDLYELIESVGIDPDTSDAGVLGNDNQYGAALVVGYGMMGDYDE